MFDRVLIANRGEIAVRVIRACRELGIRSVAVYSDPDRAALHVLEADEAYAIGGSSSRDSYLRADRLLDVARRAHVDAVHPGYGFLAERAFFAAAVHDAGLVFIGPAASAIEAMGNKTRARQHMLAAGVAVVPGTTESLRDPAAALSAAQALGFPVLLKAAAGGGGKGMRVVAAPAELPAAFRAAAAEARSSFGDDGLYLERCLARPRHIEIQVLADQHGDIVHLGERDCSIQRRHQKLIEEAPAPGLTPELRRRMGAAAVAAARAVAYTNAGTVEFLLAEDEFFFLEMNTRIQVEHPVTEQITGLDLVQWQLRIAAGERLSFAQADVTWRGHAIECRITSENPHNGFLPATGAITRLEPPGGPGIRWDGGVRAGGTVSLHYDPLLGKLVACGATRDEALARMRRALDELQLAGVETSIPFHRRVLREPDFCRGGVSIRYLEDHPVLLSADADGADFALIAAGAALLEQERRRRHVPTPPPLEQGRSRWRDDEWWSGSRPVGGWGT